jgi:hydroxymethylpyrimidine kinase/phosphomethylpyrimidine kinase
MLPTKEIVIGVAGLFRDSDLPRPVVDPVMVSTFGQQLMEQDAVGVFIQEMLPLARLITPNVPEAETLTGNRITSEAEMRIAAARIRELGAKAVLIKGGHLNGKANQEAIDLLDNEGRVTIFREPWVPNGGIRGSGCILSAAIAAGLGKGVDLEASIAAAKSFVLEAIRASL